MKEFKVNNFITLRLVDGKTLIYVSGKKFIQCKFLLLSVPIHQMGLEENIKSIDEAAERLDFKLEHESTPEIPPEIEFWGHCSNLQVWTENGYDSRFLHRNLAFPLLRRLTEEGDDTARKIFKEEIAKRLNEGNLNVFEYLCQEGYLEYLQEEEFFSILENFEGITIKLLKELMVKESKRAIKQCSRCFELPFLEKIKAFSTERYKTLFLRLSKDTSPLIWYYIIDMNFLELLSNEEIISLFKTKTEFILKMLNQIVKLTNLKYNTAIALFFERLEVLSPLNREAITYNILEFANPELLCYLRYIETYTKSFQMPRNIYFSLILEKEEAETMIKLEKIIGKQLKIREMLEGEAGELIFTIEDRHIQGILIAGQDTLPEGEKTKILELICNLKKLKMLDLCYLNLTSLPSSIENLKNLELLNLQGNKLTLPNNVFKLKRLKEINVDDNKTY
jgi:Leucine-rich repeat (LRR) protein